MTDAVAAVLALVAGTAAVRPRPVVVALDGPAGSGKTTLARRLDEALVTSGRRCAVVHMDDLYPGWDGLEAAGEILHERVLAPLRRGEPAGYERWDWAEGRYAEHHAIPEVDVLLVEGVGSFRAAHADLLDVVVDVREPDRAERLRRAVGRDGEGTRGHLQAWQDREDLLHTREGLVARADVTVGGGGMIAVGE